MKNSITFTEQQFQLLKSAFPNQVINPASKIEEIMFEAGKQHVINYIAKFVQQPTYGGRHG